MPSPSPLVCGTMTIVHLALHCDTRPRRPRHRHPVPAASPPPQSLRSHPLTTPPPLPPTLCWRCCRYSPPSEDYKARRSPGRRQHLYLHRHLRRTRASTCLLRRGEGGSFHRAPLFHVRGNQRPRCLAFCPAKPPPHHKVRIHHNSEGAMMDSSDEFFFNNILCTSTDDVEFVVAFMVVNEHISSQRPMFRGSIRGHAPGLNRNRESSHCLLYDDYFKLTSPLFNAKLFP